jgi:hypothetical protein
LTFWDSQDRPVIIMRCVRNARCARFRDSRTRKKGTFKETIARKGVARMAVPRAVTHFQKTELLGNLSRTHCCRKTFSIQLDISQKRYERLLTARQVLLVGKYEEKALLHLPVCENPVKFLLGLVDTISVLGIDNEHEALCSCVVVPPERSDLVLPSYVLMK